MTEAFGQNPREIITVRSFRNNVKVFLDQRDASGLTFQCVRQAAARLSLVERMSGPLPHVHIHHQNTTIADLGKAGRQASGNCGDAGPLSTCRYGDQFGFMSELPKLEIRDETIPQRLIKDAQPMITFPGSNLPYPG